MSLAASFLCFLGVGLVVYAVVQLAWYLER
jgi:hypothetical protein